VETASVISKANSEGTSGEALLAGPPAPLSRQFWKHKALAISAKDGEILAPSNAALEVTAAVAPVDVHARAPDWRAARVAWALLRSGQTHIACKCSPRHRHPPHA